jgi:hypothetical protein
VSANVIGFMNEQSDKQGNVTVPSEELRLSVKLVSFSDQYVPKERAATAREKSEPSNFLFP